MRHQKETRKGDTKKEHIKHIHKTEDTKRRHDHETLKRDIKKEKLT